MRALSDVQRERSVARRASGGRMHGSAHRARVSRARPFDGASARRARATRASDARVDRGKMCARVGCVSDVARASLARGAATTRSLRMGRTRSALASRRGPSRARPRASSIEDCDPNDLALVVELLDSESGEELKEKVELMAKGGLLTAGVVEAARVIVEANRASGQDEDIVRTLEDVHDALRSRLEQMAAAAVKDALTFAQELMKYFTAEDLEEATASVAVNKVQLMMREEFEKENGVSKAALAKYLDEVLPVMDEQDKRIQSALETAETAEAQAQIVSVMMQRTKERMQIEFIRDCAARMME